jgi:hypothetical protein
VAEAEGSGKEKCDRDAHNKRAKVYSCSKWVFNLFCV